MSAAISSRQLVLVVGAGRSGTSLTSGVFSQLGFRVPQPEVQANDTNPRGFGEPRWVVNFHARLMRQRKVGLFDARPAAWGATTAAAEAENVAAELREWLRGEFAQSSRVVVKDPRTVWFLPLWTSCADELDLSTFYVTTLRHPTEVLRSIRTTAGHRQTEASRAAWWICTMLNVEHATRAGRRAFLLYDDLLTGWEEQLRRVERTTGLPLLSVADAESRRAVDEFIDPSLRRVARGWDDVDVFPSLQKLADVVWEQLVSLTRDDGKDQAIWARLDGLHEDYERMYAEAEAMADSSVTYAVRSRPARRKPTSSEGAAVRSKRGAFRPQLPPTLRRVLGRVKRTLPRAT